MLRVSLVLTAGPLTVFPAFPSIVSVKTKTNRYESGDFSEPAGLAGPTQYDAVCRLADLFIRPGAREEVNIRCVDAPEKWRTTAFLPGLVVGKDTGQEEKSVPLSLCADTIPHGYMKSIPLKNRGERGKGGGGGKVVSVAPFSHRAREPSF